MELMFHDSSSGEPEFHAALSDTSGTDGGGGGWRVGETTIRSPESGAEPISGKCPDIGE
jgi:hypothetical protein